MINTWILDIIEKKNRYSYNFIHIAVKLNMSPNTFKPAPRFLKSFLRNFKSQHPGPNIHFPHLQFFINTFLQVLTAHY